MYTSGPKKMSMFPPGFVPPGAPGGGAKQPLKQAINQGPIFGSVTGSSNGGLNLSGGAPSAAKNPGSTSLPVAPKLPLLVSNTKFAMPGVAKLGNTLPTVGPSSGSTVPVAVLPTVSPTIPPQSPPAAYSVPSTIYCY